MPWHGLFKNLLLPPRLPPFTSFPSCLCSKSFAMLRIKPGRKTDAMKSSPEKASRKLGKILFTFPRRAKTMMIKAESLFMREFLSSSYHYDNQIWPAFDWLIQKLCSVDMSPRTTLPVLSVNLQILLHLSVYLLEQIAWSAIDLTQIFLISQQINRLIRNFVKC